LGNKAKEGGATFDNVPSLCYEFAMTVEWEGTVHNLEKAVTVAKLLDMLSLSKEAHLVVSNGVLVTEDRMLERDDRVRIIRVISGG
jgi:sulfur carrier protein ThiS